MKKLLSVFLSLLMIFSLFVPAFAGNANLQNRSQYPVIVISGDGDTLYDKDGNKLLRYSDLFSASSDDDDSDNTAIYESVANVLYPFLVEGLLTDHWDNYYKNLQKEISELFGDTLLDNNGEASNGSGISKEHMEENIRNMNTDKKDADGYYSCYAYQFWYDWRLDPLETADKFNEFIKGIKQVTGAEKVAITSRCLGTSVALAYIAKYGTDDIAGMGFDGGVVNGAEVLSEPISGKFKLDGNAINRFLIDCNALGMFNVDAFLTTTIDLLTKGGVFDTLVGVTKETIYYKLLEGVTSALALSTFFTWPCYWAAVCSEDYQQALNYVFGKEGSEKRTEYAGLIEKIENYDKVVRQNIPELMQEINDNANLGIIAKYGFQMGPTCESCDAVGDQIASVNRASFGATTSTIYGTLSEDYIAERTAQGKGKYISPDKQIDASTCLFPDQTWFVKNARHSNWTWYEAELLCAVYSADRQLTVDDFDLTQFMVFNNQWGSMDPMTTENCNTYNWVANENDDKPSNPALRLIAFLKSLFKWIKELFGKMF
ncbi:MAG: hypothetical protein ACI4W6_07685 [Acutalibacteraceae bacterium]